MVRVVLNRAESISSISWQEVRFSLPVDIVAQIPSEGKQVNVAVNRGIPVVIDSPRSKVSQAVRKFAQKLASDDEIFVEHSEIGNLKLKEAGFEKAGEFWQMQGLTEPLSTLVLGTIRS